MPPMGTTQVKPTARTMQDLRKRTDMHYVFSCAPNIAAFSKKLALLNGRNADFMRKCGQAPRPLIFNLDSNLIANEQISLPQNELEVLVLISTGGIKGQDLTYNNEPLHFLQFSHGELHLYAEKIAFPFYPS